MDFTFSADQQMLRESVRKALQSLPLSAARTAGAEPSISTQAWNHAAQLGWPALIAPEATGGFGMGPVEAIILAEEMGKALFTGSYRDTAILLPSILAALPGPDAKRLCEAVCNGEMHVALAFLEPGNDWKATSASEIRNGRLFGRKCLVEYALPATHYLVLIRSPSQQLHIQVALVEASQPSLSYTARTPLDITCGLGDVVFDGAKVMFEVTLPEQHGNGSLFDMARLYNCAELIGVADAALALTLAYARERKQFGQPIGSFQAIKHLLADAFVLLENAKSATYYAAISMQQDMTDRRFALDAAQAASCEMAIRVTSTCLQVHGGIGFTWEYDLHLYFKRARRLASFLGGHQNAYQNIADAIA